MDLLKLEDNNEVTIDPKILSVPNFEKIWDRDKSKSKKRARREITFVFFYVDFRSPFIKYPDSERFSEIIKVLFENDDPNWEPDDVVLEAIENYKEMVETPTMAYLRDARNAVNKLRDYFRTADLAAVDDHGNPLYDAKKFMETLQKSEGLISTIQNLEEKARQEQEQESRIRGGEGKGVFEDPDAG